MKELRNGVFKDETREETLLRAVSLVEGGQSLADATRATGVSKSTIKE